MTARSIDDILEEGSVTSAALLVAHRAGDTAEVDRLHDVLNALTKEVFATARLSGVLGPPREKIS